MKTAKLTPAEKFYSQALQILVDSKIPFLLGGTYALQAHTEIERKTKDLDLHCKASDYPSIMKLFIDKGFKTILDERWLLKVFKGDHFIDFIWNTLPNIAPVDDSWFEKNTKTTLFGVEVPVIRAEELIWNKSFRQERKIFEGPDVYHLFLKTGKTLDWKRLLRHMEAYWEVLFAHVINFRFIYPGDKDVIPKWLTQELLTRTQNQFSLPSPIGNICRGRLLSPKDYEVDINEWGRSSHTHLI